MITLCRSLSLALSLSFLLLRRKYCFRFRSFVICFLFFHSSLSSVLLRMLARWLYQFFSVLRIHEIQFNKIFLLFWLSFQMLLIHFSRLYWNFFRKGKTKIKLVLPVSVCALVCIWMWTICKDADTLFILCCALGLLLCVRFILFYFYSFHSLHIKCCKFAWNSKMITNETANCLWKRTNDMYDKQKQWSHNYWYTV